MSNRVKSVNFNTFLTTYVAGCKAEKTQAEIAADLGMNLSSFRTRLVSVRAEVVKNGKVLPDAKRAASERTSGGESRIAAMQELLADLDAAPTPEVPPTAETEGEAESVESVEVVLIGEGEVSA